MLNREDDNGAIDRATIEEVARFIAERFRPLRIVLFGSHARGEAGANSDLDLLVEFAPHDVPAGPGNAVRRAVADRFVLPCDIIIRSSDQVREFRSNPYSVIGEAFSDGEVLYERPAA